MARRAGGERLGVGDPVYGKFREFLEHNYVEISTADTLRVYRHQTHGKVVGE
jgi:hypothetical protein